MKLSLIAVLVLLVLQACTTIQHKHEPVASASITGESIHELTFPFREKGDKKSYFGGLYHLSCTDKKADGSSFYNYFDKDKNKPTRADLAKLHYMHAAMASNAYRDPKTKPIFIIPGWTMLESFESDSGLSLETYGYGTTKQNSKELVVAFRGTDFGKTEDWVNNLSLFQFPPTQYIQGYGYILKLKRENPNKKITAVGHSLGGGIAIEVAMKVEGVEAVVFNPSPRYSNDSKYTNSITVMYERGEILNGLFGQLIRFRLPSYTYIGNYDFLDYYFWTLSFVGEHGMYQFARALTVVAMTRDVEGAKDLFKANIPESVAMNFDPENCAYLYAKN